MAKPKVFISYRNVDSSKEIASRLASRLREDNYGVFWDIDDLRPGEDWKEKIYNNIYDSDVLLVLLEEKTAESDWVQREVDIARGAHVKIMPVSIIDNIDETETTDKLALSDIQFLPLSGQGYDDKEYKLIIDSVERLAKETENAQNDLKEILKEKRRGNRADKHSRLASFRLAEPSVDDEHRVHLATGDITDLKNIDVFVNSENDFMQMARVHEKNTVSSTLRYHGSLIIGKSVEEDTIQSELNAQIELVNYGRRPIVTGEVIITSAGHKKGKLRKSNKIQYIIHAATVEVKHSDAKASMNPIEYDDDIRQCVINCLEAINEIDEASGVISPEGSNQRQGQEENKDNYQPMKSVVFPLFGTGQGGRSAAEVVPPMLEGFREFWGDYPDSSLTEIYLCVYQESDVSIVRGKMRDAFEQIDAE